MSSELCTIAQSKRTHQGTVLTDAGSNDPVKVALVRDNYRVISIRSNSGTTALLTVDRTGGALLRRRRHNRDIAACSGRRKDKRRRREDGSEHSGEEVHDDQKRSTRSGGRSVLQRVRGCSSAKNKCERMRAQLFSRQNERRQPEKGRWKGGGGRATGTIRGVSI